MEFLAAELIGSKVHNLIEEMEFLLARSAFSSIMRESRDCSFGLCDARARIIVPSLLGSHSHCYASAARHLLQDPGPERLRPDTMFIGNHPHEIGIPHTPDILVMLPVYSRGELVAFCGALAHKPDIGGAVPGSSFLGATELIQEGLLIPFMEFTPAVEAILRANVRNPELVLGDLRAQVGIVRVGAKRLAEVYDRYGASYVETAFDAMLSETERRLRSHLECWAGRRVEAERFLDLQTTEGAEPLPLKVAVTCTGDEIEFDFTGTASWQKSPINCPPYSATAVCWGVLSAMTDPSIPYNDGFSRVVRVTVPPDSLLQPPENAPVGSATQVTPVLADAILEALSELEPARAVADGGSNASTLLAWTAGRVANRTYIQYEIHGAGCGAGAQGDGVSGALPFRNGGGAMNGKQPIEILETEYPIRLISYGLIRDSGGAGLNRGGLGYRREYEVLQPVTINLHRNPRVGSHGLRGGHGGAKGRFVLDPGTPDEREVLDWLITLKAGQRFAVETSGGAGYGDPQDRDPEKVFADVLNGLVSVSAALEVYGVAIQCEDGLPRAVDHDATAELRKPIAAP